MDLLSNDKEVVIVIQEARRVRRSMDCELVLGCIEANQVSHQYNQGDTDTVGARHFIVVIGFRGMQITHANRSCRMWSAVDPSTQCRWPSWLVSLVAVLLRIPRVFLGALPLDA